VKFLLKAAKRIGIVIPVATLVATQLLTPAFAIGDPMSQRLPYYLPGNTCSNGSTGGTTTPGSGATQGTAKQDANARTIIGVAKFFNLGQQGALIGLMVGITETHLTNDANVNVPISETNPAKEGDGSDHDSVGIMQQRTSTGWSTFGTDVTNNKDGVYQLMTPAYAAQAFFGTPANATLPGNLANPGALKKGLQNKPNWQSMDPGDAAQAVQGSAPNAYNQNKAAAQDFLNRLWESSPTVKPPIATDGGTSGGGSAGGCTGAGVSGNFNQTLLKYAWPTYHPPVYNSKTPDYAAAVSAAQKSGQYVGGDVSIDPTYAGIDCGGFVTLLMKNSGTDPNYNKYNGNTTAQKKYLDEQVAAKKYTIVSNPTTGTVQPGDIAINSEHTFIYVGTVPGFNAKIASASQDERAPMADDKQTVSTDFTWYRLVQAPSTTTQGTPQP